jgi:hypothetical protein
LEGENTLKWLSTTKIAKAEETPAQVEEISNTALAAAPTISLDVISESTSPAGAGDQEISMTG